MYSYALDKWCILHCIDTVPLPVGLGDGQADAAAGDPAPGADAAGPRLGGGPGLRHHAEALAALRQGAAGAEGRSLREFRMVLQGVRAFWMVS